MSPNSVLVVFQMPRHVGGRDLMRWIGCKCAPWLALGTEQQDCQPHCKSGTSFCTTFCLTCQGEAHEHAADTDGAKALQTDCHGHRNWRLQCLRSCPTLKLRKHILSWSYVGAQVEANARRQFLQLVGGASAARKKPSLLACP